MSPTSKTRGFLGSCPYLDKVPHTIVLCPSGLEQLSKRLDLEESRITDESKMHQPEVFRAFIYQYKVDMFHWNLSGAKHFFAYGFSNLGYPNFHIWSKMQPSYCSKTRPISKILNNYRTFSIFSIINLRATKNVFSKTFYKLIHFNYLKK